MDFEQPILDMFEDFMADVEARMRRQLREFEGREPDTLTREDQREVEQFRALLRLAEPEGGNIVQ